ncbi:MAG: pentapeptide repeat-containing protein [Pirellulaceae bacterium]
MPKTIRAVGIFIQDLSNANLYNSTLADTDLSGATVTGADLSDTTSRGFTKEQLCPTASYREKNLQELSWPTMTYQGWDFRDQNLESANFARSKLTNVNLSGTTVAGAKFARTSLRGFTKEQLYSTASYQAKNLAGIDLSENYLSGCGTFEAKILATHQ